MTQRENGKVEADLAIARAMIRAGKALNKRACLHFPSYDIVRRMSKKHIGFLISGGLEPC